MKRYLQLSRAHTAPLETIPAVIGSSLAVGTLWNPFVAIWGVYGFLYHIAGYSHNSYADWYKGYDKDDPNKQHHPLNQDDFGPYRATSFVHACIFFTIIFVVLAISASVLFYSGIIYAVPSIIILVVGYITGTKYNSEGKETTLKFIPITIAHTTVFALPYVALGGDSIYIFVSGCLFMFMWIIFQIGVSGEIKDIMQDESNFLKRIGTKAYRDSDKDKLVFSLEAKEFAHTINILGVVFCILFSMFIGADLNILINIAIVGSGTVFLTISLVKNGEYKRETRITSMSLREFIYLLIMMMAATPVIGNRGLIILAVLSSIWLLTMNKIEWGTYFNPKV